ncbi:MAG: SWIM zinc finger family protein [Bacillota bacterium]|jgi:uncharacterized Zn finger protein
MKYNETGLNRIIDRATYAKGLNYYFEGRVEELDFDGVDTIRVVVRGTFSYQFLLEISEDGKLTRANCNCPAFYQYEVCKHIAAVIIAMQRSNHERGKKKKRITKMLFNHYTRRSYEEKIPVQLEINLEVRTKIFSRRRLSAF